MEWNGVEIPDLWETLRTCGKTVVLYGMGNGADKILDVCAHKGIAVREVFASDDFVRGQSFHGMTVRKWNDIKAQYGAEHVVVLLAFATSRPDVLQNILSIAAETTLYVPDVPVFGDTLFDSEFLHSNRSELSAARALLCDDESRRVFDLIIRYKLSGEIAPLLESSSTPEDAMYRFVQPRELTATADLGAYTGDTVRELLGYGALPHHIYAMEPDARNFRKLSEYAAQETRTEVRPIRAAAWNRNETLLFDGSGNRNASAERNRSLVLNDRPIKSVEIPAMPLDEVLNGDRVDYIKYDVEGSERQALEGSAQTIRQFSPALLVSLYHRSEDLFSLPLMIREMFPGYDGFYLRRHGGVPAWDLNLYVRKERY